MTRSFDPKCPTCGWPLQKRKRLRDGKPFWGCTRWPDCRQPGLALDELPTDEAYEIPAGGRYAIARLRRERWRAFVRATVAAIRLGIDRNTALEIGYQNAFANITTAEAARRGAMRLLHEPQVCAAFEACNVRCFTPGSFPNPQPPPTRVGR